jgi:hypothetical protein
MARGGPPRNPEHSLNDPYYADEFDDDIYDEYDF